jgi:hypothetical protein
MKIALAIGALIASLGGCVIVPADYGDRGDRSYYRGDGYYRGYYRGDGYYYRDRYYRSYGYQDHGQ